MALVPRKESGLAVRERPELVTGARLWWQQFGALCWKHCIIRLRSWKTNLLLLAQAVLFVFLIWAVDRAIANSRQRQPAFQVSPLAEAEALTSIPDCQHSIFLRQGEPCYTLLYSPAGDPAVERIVAGVAANNNPPIPAERVRGFANASLVDEFLLEHPETVLAAVAFSVEAPGSIGFSLQTNSSVQWFKGAYQNPNTYVQLPLQAAVEREAVRLMAGAPALRWDVDVTTFTHPAANSPSMIGQVAPTFLFASIMFQFVLLVHDVVEEKEGGMRRAMAAMGLRAGPFWASWLLVQGALAVAEAALLVGFSYAFGFRLFTRNAFGLSFLLLLLVSLAMMAFGFAVAALLQKAAAAVPVGFLVFVVGWIFLIVIAFGFPYSSEYSTAAVAVFSAFPWSLLSKGVQDLAAAADSRYGGIPFANAFSYCRAGSSVSPEQAAALGYWQKDCVMPLGQIYWVLAVQVVSYLGLAFYLDAVVPDSYGVAHPPWFPLQPSFWAGRRKRRSVRAAARALQAPSERDADLAVDADVQQEADQQRALCQQYVAAAGGAAERVQRRWWQRGAPSSAATPGGQQAPRQLGQEQRNGDDKEMEIAADNQPQYAVQMFGLRKTYRSRALPFRRREFVAVRGNWLGVREGECFCLLGPNGAGKSTTINCLTGVIPFSGGDALVYGESLASAGGMDAARPLMGVCPQFDVLLDQLSGREHLLLFGAIKGLPLGECRRGADSLLEAVKLLEAGRVRAGAYSGGMRRRLSVAIALLGDPKVVYLDEPTTGLDPISRRHLWDLVHSAKAGRAIVLTTHSMEEADVLGDRIGIMARGRLRCLGTGLRLKARFGSGYRISIRVQGGSAAGVAAAGAGAAASATPLADSAGWNPLPPGAGAAHAGPRVTLLADATGPALRAGARAPPPASAGTSSCGSAASSPTALAGPAGGGSEAGAPPEEAAPLQRGPEAERQARAVRELFVQRLGIKTVDESLGYLHFLVPYEAEDQLPLLLTFLKARRAALGVADVQLRLSPLEEVFLAVTRRAELEHAQAQGQTETLVIAEENIALRVPVGAEFIQSPAGHLYHLRWVQDEDGRLRLRDYWRDCASTALLTAASSGDAPGAKAGRAGGGTGATGLGSPAAGAAGGASPAAAEEQQRQAAVAGSRADGGHEGAAVADALPE